MWSWQSVTIEQVEDALIARIRAAAPEGMRIDLEDPSTKALPTRTFPSGVLYFVLAQHDPNREEGAQYDHEREYEVTTTLEPEDEDSEPTSVVTRYRERRPDPHILMFDFHTYCRRASESRDLDQIFSAALGVRDPLEVVPNVYCQTFAELRSASTVGGDDRVYWRSWSIRVECFLQRRTRVVANPVEELVLDVGVK
jgi:hypothetical protein